MTNRGSAVRFAWLILCALLFELLTAPTGAAAETLRWTRTRGMDGGTAVAIGPGGTIHVAGLVYREDSYGSLALMQYAASGARNWTRVFHVEGDGLGTGVAVAPDGSIYMTGRICNRNAPSCDLVVQKYSPSGTRIWTKRYDEEGRIEDYGYGVAVGRDGAVYVVGCAQVNREGYNLLLLKYSPAGDLLWETTYNREGISLECGRGVTVGSDGGVYVTGQSQVRGQRRDLLIQKYSASGEALWTRFYGRSDGYVHGTAVAPGPDDSVYVIGNSLRGAGVQTSTLLLQKYSPSGDRLWTRAYSGTQQTDYGLGVAVDPGGSVYAVGTTRVDWNRDQLLLQKYSATGIHIWTKTFSGFGSGSEGASGVDVGIDGSICVAGGSEGRGLLLQKYK